MPKLSNKLRNNFIPAFLREAWANAVKHKPHPFIHGGLDGSLKVLKKRRPDDGNLGNPLQQLNVSWDQHAVFRVMIVPLLVKHARVYACKDTV
jgi:hypothetical protein